MEIDSGPGPQPTGPDRHGKELSFAGLVSETFNLWTRKVIQYAIIVGVTVLVLTIIELFILLAVYGFPGIGLIDFIGSSPLDVLFNLIAGVLPSQYMMIVAILSFVNLLVYAIVAGAAIDYAVDNYENPGSEDISESFSFATGRMVDLILVQFIQSLILLPIAFLAVFLLFFDVLIALAMIILILYIAVRLAPAVAVVVIEEKSAVAAIGRSWQITGGLFWHIFGGLILMAIITFIISIVIGIVVGTLIVFIVPSIEISVLIGSLITSLFLSSVPYIFQAVLYKDLESRGTSSDLDWWK